jgi:hypothetical protein
MLDAVTTWMDDVAGDAFEQHITLVADVYAVVLVQHADDIADVFVCSQAWGLGVISETAD